MGEHSIVAARASVMIYDDGNKRWVPSGSSQGLSKVHIYHHSVNNTFRVVGRKLQDHEVVINCAILKGLKYNQATPTFHQWRDNRQVYGLNFTSKEDADNFAQAMFTALDTLNNAPRQPVAAPQTGLPPTPQQSHYHQPQIQQMAGPGGPPQPPQQQISVNGPAEIQENNERLSHAGREPYQTHQRKGSRGSNQGAYMAGMWDPASQSAGQAADMSSPQTQALWQQQQQHHQQPQPQPPQQQPQSVAGPAPTPVSSVTAQSVPPAPPAPPAPPGPPPPVSGIPKPPPAPPMPAPQVANSAPPSAPPAPPGPAPPPPPPLPTANDEEEGGPPPAPPLPAANEGGLAAALKSATLRKVPKPDQKDAADSDGGVNYAANAGTLGRGSSSRHQIPGANDMMSEMARKLKQRKAKVEGATGDEQPPPPPPVTAASNDKKPWERQNNQNAANVTAPSATNGNSKQANGSESPRPSRSRRFQSLTGQESFSNGQSACGSASGASAALPGELEGLKQEIMTEMRKEIQKAKQEIIEAMKAEFNRR